MLFEKKNKEERNVAITRVWVVPGWGGHRQRESFNESYVCDFSKPGDVRVLEVFNSDRTGTNDFSILKITRNTADECADELCGQISDGIFENSRTGLEYEIPLDRLADLIR